MYYYRLIIAYIIIIIIVIITSIIACVILLLSILLRSVRVAWLQFSDLFVFYYHPDLLMHLYPLQQSHRSVETRGGTDCHLRSDRGSDMRVSALACANFIHTRVVLSYHVFHVSVLVSCHTPLPEGMVLHFSYLDCKVLTWIKTVA